MTVKEYLVENEWQMVVLGREREGARALVVYIP
jgi:hypothetical protein